MYQKIDEMLWKITMCISRKKGMTAAYRDVDPLYWYINTGRASTAFLKALLSAKPFVIARVLAKGGSVDEAIKAVKAKLGMPEEEC